MRGPTWDHVEEFYGRKVRRDGTLSMRVPFTAGTGDALTIALELPSTLVLDVIGSVLYAEPAPDGKKTSVRMQLHGLTEQLRGRLEALVAESRASAFDVDGKTADGVLPAPQPSDVPVDEVVPPPPTIDVQRVDADERPAFLALEAELTRLREAAAHEVLGVAWDADVPAIRRAYFGLTKHYHPDVFARYRGKAIGELAQELFILVNKAYDRMRDAAVAAGSAIVAGPALLPHRGWLADIDDDVGEQPTTPVPGPLPQPPEPVRAARAGTAPPVVSFSKAAAGDGVQLTGDSLFGDLDLQAQAAAAVAGAPPPVPALAEEVLEECRTLLRDGAARPAAERLAAALRDDPRNRKLRALYHVANGRVLLEHGDVLQATAQLQAALAHDRDCIEARTALEAIQQGGARKDGGLFKRWFK
ncbi:MAG TPA: J domain-containing protein [Kofleriaceae bacterium]|nr:J domain-containing protein [Kofleriaceae bacterium]